MIFRNWRSDFQEVKVWFSRTEGTILKSEGMILNKCTYDLKKTKIRFKENQIKSPHRFLALSIFANDT